MFTTIDKAIAAVLGGALSFLALKFGVQVEWMTPDLINSISIAVAGVLTYVVPNRS